MIHTARLPPLYRLVPVDSGDDVAAEARRLAADGADPATMVCAERDDRLACAVILHPDAPLAEACLAVYVGALGLGDALGAVVPAGLDLTYHWPNRIAANVATVAEIGIDAQDADPAEWMILTAGVAIRSDGDAAPGFAATTLHDEGCVEVTVTALLESFARHFLTWVNRWQDDGFEPVRAMWLRHAPDHRKEIEIAVDGGTRRGVFGGIGDDGALLLETGDAVKRVDLGAALAAARR